MVIEITKDGCLCDEENMQDYVDILNGIVYECYEHLGFEHGTRNTIAVDLTVAAHMLGLDATKVLDWLVEEDVINPCDDDEDTYRRVETVLDYKHRFSWNYMIDPSHYVFVAREHANDIKDMPVQFVIH